MIQMNQTELWSLLLKHVDSLQLKSWVVETLGLSILVMFCNCFFFNYLLLKCTLWFTNGSVIFYNCHTAFFFFFFKICFEFRYKCDGCDAFIVETCFQCNVCSNFHLCMGCYKSGKYPKRCVVFTSSVFFWILEYKPKSLS